VRLLTDDGARVAVVAIALMAGCSALLGVLLGWYLRGFEVKRLRWKVAYLQGELRKCWSKKVYRVGKRGITGGE
jgi:hypothetical protein